MPGAGRPFVVPACALAAAVFAGFAWSIAWGRGPFPTWTEPVVQPVGVFFIAVGTLVGLKQHDGRRMGLLLILMGGVYYLGDLQHSGNPWLFRVGFVFFHLNAVVLAHLLLAFPDGRLTGTLPGGVRERSRWERPTILALYVTTPLTQAVRAAVERPLRPQLWGDPHAHYSVWAPVGSAVEISLTMVMLALVYRRWHGESAQARKARGIFWISVASIGGVAVLLGLAALLHAPLAWQGALLALYAVAIALLGLAALLGLVRTLLAHRRMLREFGTIGPTVRLQERLAGALGERGLVLLYHGAEPGEFEDGDGRSVALPVPSPDQALSVIGPAEQPLGVLLHDRFLAEYPNSERLRAATMVAALILRAQRADRIHGQELREARANEASRTERLTRMRILRDTHDGAGNSLGALMSWLRESAQLCEDPVLADRWARAVALAEAHRLHFRESLGGIYPTVLDTLGLKGALEKPAGAFQVKVIMPEEPDWSERLTFELYSIASEAIANADTHGKASHVTVTLRQLGDRVVMTVEDDGRGGARERPGGHGMRTMRARAESCDGTFGLTSHVGGTTIRVELRCV
ncbi:sensor histidine kinase [Kitasatospora sp. NPDC127111]|uniref:sensor histidine kinase n=1 Tax=Kitasatospora sp. NPDC127111 TaxID=3345363 RepID=UPI0036427AD1